MSETQKDQENRPLTREELLSVLHQAIDLRDGVIAKRDAQIAELTAERDSLQRNYDASRQIYNDYRSEMREELQRVTDELNAVQAQADHLRGLLAVWREFDEREDEWSAEIAATETDHEVYAAALDMVSHRFNKASLVRLVHWLIVGRNTARAEVTQLKADGFYKPFWEIKWDLQEQFIEQHKEQVLLNEAERDQAREQRDGALARAEKAEADRDRYQMLWQEGEKRVAGTEMIYAEAVQLRAALTELVALKDMKDSLPVSSNRIDLYRKYRHRQPVAWMNARKALAGVSSSDNATEAP